MTGSAGVCHILAVCNVCCCILSTRTKWEYAPQGVQLVLRRAPRPYALFELKERGFSHLRGGQHARPSGRELTATGPLARGSYGI
ncbi:hypothetical protein DM02DRAFT_380966 [Periconia macrospinosa]|uniref:Secreted protein n=1 Tax=Periconia macrospinosa TaxID=97972 RepID=A0A2V1E9E8_9PLEO|nr:hypothetical protein DM02DRAFT_380966 [Periconia macrospinosa]